jgi:hypothetical protein
MSDYSRPYFPARSGTDVACYLDANYRRDPVRGQRMQPMHMRMSAQDRRRAHGLLYGLADVTGCKQLDARTFFGLKCYL